MSHITSPQTVLKIIRNTPWRFLGADGNLFFSEEPRQESFKGFLDALEQWLCSNRGIITFRGEKKAALREKLFLQSERPGSYQELLCRLFVLGEKARRFRHPYDKMTYLRDFNDISLETFDFIAERITTLMRPPDSKINFSRRIFQSENEHFADFCTRESLQQLREHWRLSNPDSRKLLRDYYLYLLHTVGNSKIKDVSFFVSTSRDVRIAEQFALGQQKERTAFIIYYWMPLPFEPHAVNLATITRWSKDVGNMGFPTFTSDLYPHQSEIAVRGALFPHFILGVHDLEEGCFVPNPHLTDLAQNNFIDVLEEGAEIEHQRFLATIRSAGYQKFILRRADFYEERAVL